MTLDEFLERAAGAFDGADDTPVSFALLAGPAGAWRPEKTMPVTGVRVGEDEVLVETDPAGGATPRLTVGGLLARLRALAAEHGGRPVEACEPDVDAGGGVRVRVDYPVDGTGRDEATGTCLLVCVAGGV